MDRLVALAVTWDVPGLNLYPEREFTNCRFLHIGLGPLIYARRLK